ncbi:SDR family NAD(P)-dependent oxidoreductase [Extensimonas sp. H3M7-6]|uniref:SDR family NAD(P)-dependent oxidoreductase n=1 Tax=Extensimonas soli TaxID=3031322 RepID=UPI0023D97A42|nr:SDR family NAD(P)-dependent oxidoreductase [Extensimonas sp. H3M7-6]MDF1483173.1 SDR family NAD(P)-dependent oxidoreductase [Extensimonas sp. H3M7-6]
MKRVQDKVILVTGGAMGMGQTHSELLAEQGAWVFAADLNQEKGQAVVEGIRKKGGKADFLKLDVTQEADWNAAIAQIIERAGRIDVLVNNAGILIMKPVQDTTNDEWDRIFAVNVRGVFVGTRAVIPHMQKAGKGNCRIPDDCIDSRRYPLFMARAVLQALIEEHEQASKGARTP